MDTRTTLPARIEMVDPAMAQVLREKTVSQRLAIASGMWRSAREILRNIIRSDNPRWSDLEVNREVARRLSHGYQ